ncbi:hypothetical protein WA026_000405 [Henosepilachna vigintioctopunctata]|uniref:Uncharacterized protein n=1 Tax=Henosepilachna vigintioctopunctata TaxID=420089 RepID=A0AAW1V892_9CUCU
MKGGLIIFSLYVLALFVNVESAALSTSDREKAIEDIIVKSFGDPYNFGSFDAAPGNGVLKVHQNITSMIVHGLSKARRIVHADLAAGTISMTYEADQLSVNVNYDIDGSWHLMKIWGKGTGVVVMNDVRTKVEAKIELVNDKIKINDMKISYEVSGGSFDLDSLFGETGDMKIFTPIFLKAVNLYNKYVFPDILPPYIPLAEAGLTKVWSLILANA